MTRSTESGIVFPRARIDPVSCIIYYYGWVADCDSHLYVDRAVVRRAVVQLPGVKRIVMKINHAWAAIILSVVLIAAIVAMSFHSLSPVLSPDVQRVRMYLVFAAYLVLLLAVRSLMRSNSGHAPATGWMKRIKVIIGSIAASGAVLICGIVLWVVIGGAHAVEVVMPKLLYAVPVIAILCAPFLSKRMS